MDDNGRLLIDVHCHVFSGRDIPLAEFLYYGRGVPWGVAKFVEWAVTHPSGTMKQAKAVAIAEGGTQSDFQEAEERNVIERFFAYGGLMGRSVKSITAQMVADFKQVDLFTPAITDMDCWLGDASFYDDRVREHADLATDKKFKGRVHPIVGFDPIRQHATRQAFGAGNDHLEQIRKAIEEQGFVGVKVYPPMGYRPARNDRLYPAPAKVRRPDGKPVRCQLEKNKKSVAVDLTGQEVDDAMLQLFDYCVAKDVPVMAHCTGHGAEAARGRGLNSDPRHWKALLGTAGGKYSSLRLNLAHFGGDTGRPSFVQGVAELVAAFPNVYADVGAHDLVNAAGGAGSQMTYAYELMSALEEGADWTKKIMFGTDWHTTYVQPSPRAYVRQYLKFFDAFLSGGNAGLQADFRGRTALRFLGLDKQAPNDATRKRIEAFYEKNGLFTLTGTDKPVWW